MGDITIEGHDPVVQRISEEKYNALMTNLAGHDATTVYLMPAEVKWPDGVRTFKRKGFGKPQVDTEESLILVAADAKHSMVLRPYGGNFYRIILFVRIADRSTARSLERQPMARVRFAQLARTALIEAIAADTVRTD
jgi:hypothetical protein